MNEQIQRLKNNFTVLRGLPLEDVEFLKKHRPQVGMLNSKLELTYVGKCGLDDSLAIYRLAPEFQETEEHWRVYDVLPGCLGFVDYNATPFYLSSPPSNYGGVQFEGQKYPNIWYMNHRSLIDARGYVKEAAEEHEKMKPAKPTRVRLWYD